MNTERSSSTHATPSSSSSTSSSDHLLVLPCLPPAIVNTLNWLSRWYKLDTVTLNGYQLWAVEQRVTDRTSLLPLITVFTGNQEDAITVDRFALSSTTNTSSSPSSQTEWENIKNLFKKSGARLSTIQQGIIPVTALPSLPPNLSLVQIPNRQTYAQVVDLLYQNINLRRLGLGGRSSLRLAQATPAQMLHFRQCYHLPIPPPTSSTSNNPSQPFGETVLNLIKLVQNGLSLFGLGIVQSTSPNLNSTSTSSARNDEAEYRLREGDGLLCDVSLSALFEFKLEISEPFFSSSSTRFKSDESILSPDLLASLISIILSTKGKMIFLGAEELPKDPFERRSKFLKGLIRFQKENKFSRIDRVLTKVFLKELNERYSNYKKNGVIKGGGRKVVGRALKFVAQDTGSIESNHQKIGHSNRAGEDDLLGTGGGGGDGSGGVTSGRKHLRRNKGEQIETIDLEKLIREMEKGVGGSTTAELWGLRRGRRDRREDERERRKEDIDGSATDGIGGGTGTPSENENLGFGRGVLKGVREKAGNVGRKLGDNLGFTDATVASLTSHQHGHETPSVTISSPDPASYRSSRVSTFNSQRNSTHKSVESSGGTANDSDIARSASTSHRSKLTSKITSALTNENGSGPVKAVRNRFRESPGTSYTKSSTVPSSSKSSSLFLDVGEQRITLPRRTVSDAYTVPTLASIIAGETSFAYSGSGASTTEDEGRERRASIMMHHRPGQARRHSFNILIDADEPIQWLSRKRLQIDVELRTAAWELASRERELKEMKSSLKIVLASYDSALESISAPLSQKLSTLVELQRKANSVQEKVSEVTSPGSTLSELSISTSRILYAQDALERNNVSETQSARTTLGRSIGPSGMLRNMMMSISKERRGMRRLVSTLETWSNFLSYLQRRGKWYIWKVAAQSDQNMIEEQEPVMPA